MSMQTKWVWGSVALLAVIALAWGVYNLGFNQRAGQQQKNQSVIAPVVTATPAATAEQVKIIDISGKPFEFDMKEIRVNKGDRVRINFTNSQGFHDWVLDGYNVRTKQIQAGQTDSIEFVADKAGEFDFYCSVPTHRDKGMMGKLVVE